MQSEPSPQVNPSASATANLAGASALTTVVATLATFKAGWRTSEFRLTFAGFLGTLLASLLGALPAEWAAVICPVIALSYHILRASAKDAQHEMLVQVADAVLGHLADAASLRPLQGHALLAPVERLAEELHIKVSTHGADEAIETLRKMTAAADEAVSAVKNAQAAKPSSQLPGLGLGLCAMLMLGGCAMNAPLKARFVSLAHAEGKQIVHLIGGAVDRAAEAETARLNSAIEAALK